MIGITVKCDSRVAFTTKHIEENMFNNVMIKRFMSGERQRSIGDYEIDDTTSSSNNRRASV